MNRQMVNIYLHGALGQEFGEKWTLNVGSPAEALRAIDVNTRGRFRRYFNQQNRAALYRFYIKNEDNHLTKDELNSPIGRNDFHVVPIVEGANSPWAKIGIAALIIASFWIPGVQGFLYTAGTAATATTAATAGSFTMAGLFAVSIASSLLLGGIAQLLTPTKKQEGQLNSNVFQGNIAAGQQGGSVPIVYGTALVAPTPVSIKFNNVDYSVTANTYIGAVQIMGLPGGGYIYAPFATTPIQTSSDG